MKVIDKNNQEEVGSHDMKVSPKEFKTLLSEVASIINSRPLCHGYLTPEKLVYGKATKRLPEASNDIGENDLLKIWITRRNRIKVVWNVWSTSNIYERSIKIRMNTRGQIGGGYCPDR